jgi:hypothetical protein
VLESLHGTIDPLSFCCAILQSLSDDNRFFVGHGFSRDVS